MVVVITVNALNADEFFLKVIVRHADFTTKEPNKNPEVWHDHLCVKHPYNS